MSFIINRKINNATYVYEVTSYRDKQGKKKAKHRILGKLDNDGVLITRKRKLPAEIKEVKIITKKFIIKKNDSRRKFIMNKKEDNNENKDLERFVSAQKDSYETALREIKAGRKKSHWIWYIFPQLKGLGYSYNANYYGLKNISEARSYLNHPVLGQRLLEITGALMNLNENDPAVVMGGFPDDKKLQSCMTLFAYISEKDSIFQRVIDKFFGGQMDEKTIKLMKTVQL